MGIKYILIILLLGLSLYAENDPRLKILQDKSAYDTTREAIIKVLVKDKVKEVVPILIDIIKNKNEKLKIRMLAINSLSTFKDPKGVFALGEVINDINEPDEIRIAAINSLGDTGTKEAREILGESLAMSDPMGELLEKVALNLSKIGNKDDIPYFAPVLNHKNEKLRLATISFLERVADKYSLPIVAFFLSDKSIEIRKRAIRMVSKLGGSSILPTLIVSLIEENDISVKEIIIEELNKVKIVPIKKKFISELENYYYRETDEKIKPKIKLILDKLKTGSDVK